MEASWGAKCVCALCVSVCRLNGYVTKIDGCFKGTCVDYILLCHERCWLQGVKVCVCWLCVYIWHEKKCCNTHRYVSTHGRTPGPVPNLRGIIPCVSCVYMVRKLIPHCTMRCQCARLTAGSIPYYRGVFHVCASRLMDKKRRKSSNSRNEKYARVCVLWSLLL